MDFSVSERLQLLNLTTGLEGNLVTLRVVRDLRTELSFTETEIAELGFQQDGAKVSWTKVLPPKSIEVGAAARAAVVGVFKKVEDSGKLTFDLLPLYEKFLIES